MLLDGNPGESRALLLAKSDEEVLAASLKNPAHFEVLVDRYEVAFLRKALHIMRTQEAAEDAVQDTFVKMYLHGRKFHPVAGATFKSWGYRILVNTCFTAYKKAKREHEFRSMLDPELQELVADKSIIEEREQELNRDEILSYVSTLPDNLGRILKLHFIEGKPHKDIAEIEGISEGAVRARVHRAKNELKELHQKRKAAERKILEQPKQ